MQKAVVIGAGRYEKNHPRRIAYKQQGRGDGTEDSYVPSRVLEYTLAKHSPAVRMGEIKIINTYGIDKPQSRIRMPNPTPFSYVRYQVPELCKFDGYGVYMDADQIVFADVKEVFDLIELADKPLLCAPDPSVIAYKCFELKDWNAWEWARGVEEGTHFYKKLRLGMLKGNISGELPGEWNHLDNYVEGETKLLHYTRLRSQPWIFPGTHKHEKVWVKELVGAIEAGMITGERLNGPMNQLLKQYAPELEVPIPSSSSVSP